MSHPLEIFIKHLLRHGQAVEIVGLYLHTVRNGLLRVVERPHHFVVCACVADASVAKVTANVLLDHPIHLRVDNQRNRPVYKLEKRISRELRRNNKVNWVQLVLFQGVFSEQLEHVGQQANVAQMGKRHIRLYILKAEILTHVLACA